MRKLFSILIATIVFSLAAYGAKYKINSTGKVTTPKGITQQGSALNDGSGLYNNYSSEYYTSAKQVLNKQVGTIDIVMDYSGSMANWIVAAKNSMATIISQLPSSTRIGFRVFGQYSDNNTFNPPTIVAKVKDVSKTKNGKYQVQAVDTSYIGSLSGACLATKNVASVTSNNTNILLNGMNSVTTGGSTPLTFALYEAVEKDFKGMAKNFPKKIVLITDGGENCGGDPCAFAKQLMQKRNDIHIDVVLVSSSSLGLKCLSTITGGKIYKTNDLSGFSDVLVETLKSTPQEVEVETPNQQYEYIKN